MDSTTFKRIVTTVVLVVIGITLASVSGSLVEYLPADEIMVMQYPNGKLVACTKCGFYGQWFGVATHYKRRSQFWFSADPKEGGREDESVTIRFNDNAHGFLSGSLSWEMPEAPEKILKLHEKYTGQERVLKELIAQQANKSIYMTGSLMSSKESAAEKRPDILSYIEDQMQNGVYKTQSRTVTETDPITSMTKTVVNASIILDKDGNRERVEQSLLKAYGLNVGMVAIKKIKYEDKVEAQLQQQQQATMDVQTAIATSRMAEQRALTVEKEGMAAAAKAKWAQEEVKAREITKAEQEKSVAITKAEQQKKVAETEAEQKLQVAKLDAQAAEQFKLAETLRGEGEAARRRLVMAADGALEKRLEAWVTVCGRFADAMQNFKGNLVPSVVMTGSGSGGQSSAADLLDLFKVKTAKDLALDMSITPQASTATTTTAAHK